LKDLEYLESLYLFQTRVAENSKQILKQSFPNSNIDYGGYTVPALASDTVVLKEPKKQ
jgi:hypothetical protein